MLVDPGLLEILVCPACRDRLFVDADARELVCQACRLAYPVTDDGIPAMLAHEARAL
ncbi:MAG: Trm112 family protein [Aeromicrobium sp.]|uniref:Trm112 family protein n=1 Tax=Aeromicrobium sp. TaxID=1871063 RepID=UPI0039E61039